MNVENDQQFRCSICFSCDSYEPWINRKSTSSHEKTAKHSRNQETYEKEQADIAEAEKLRAAAYSAPSVDLQPEIVHSELYDHLPEAFSAPPFAIPAWIDQDAADELHQMYSSHNSDTHQEVEGMADILQKEVQYLLEVTEENELGLWIEEEDEHLVASIEHELQDGIAGTLNGMYMSNQHILSANKSNR